jgi:SAM-dependent methyltransferase
MACSRQHEETAVGVRRSPYSRKFFEQLDLESVASARVVVPILRELLQPESVVDVGCGTGAWLSVFVDVGVKDITGVDGQQMEPPLLRIPRHRFIVADLEQPLELKRQYDLVLCLEVAEHLPATAASQLIRTLITLGDVILFSAAIPLQDGTGHVNEQWPDYWAHHFEAHGYVLIDCLRTLIWDEPTVQPFIAQNLLLYVKQSYLASNERLQRERQRAAGLPLRLVHPRVFTTSSIRRARALFLRRFDQ